MKFNVLLLSVSAALALSACNDDTSNARTGNASASVPNQPVVAEQINGPALTGTATIDQLTTLPRGLSLVVKLVDMTDAASLPVIVAESTQPAPQILPLTVAQAYDPAKIEPGHHYGLQVALQAETLVLYGTESPIPVLTHGEPTKGLKFELVRGGQPAADVPPSEQAKAEFAKLEENIGALRRIHGERLEAEVAVGWDAFVEDSGQIRMAREQVDYGDAGSAQFRYAYKGGKPWVVERVQGNDKVLLGWNETGVLVLNEENGSQSDPTALYARAEALYAQAEKKR